MNSSRLRWQCRRGMLELDLMLEAFLEQRYEQLSERERSAFEELLTYPDQLLQDYFYGRAAPIDAGIADVIQKIRQPADH
ncbi:MAG: hypothetical protein A2V90_03650 [Gammaproteobacteria bacterium RBG_16_57_12]|nr:MAG: hypothetical protein A2V90_03650 [Gammaproteobacteria bacterium RBG_16_57_12]